MHPLFQYRRGVDRSFPNAPQVHPFDLEVVNTRDLGQGLWMKKHVYWIPVLHIDDQEVARERGFGPPRPAKLLLRLEPFYVDESIV